MSDSALFRPLSLPSGQVLRNRVAKAAMEENLGEPGQLPGAALFELYRRWSLGGAGLLITGNVMIDPEAVTGPHGPVLDASSPAEPYRAWSAAAQEGGALVWMQINHPGRQVRADLGSRVRGPSAIAIDGPPGMWPVPEALTEAGIAEIVERFAVTAERAIDAGFDGVQIHGAHGYLINQFLSPLANRRDDGWGGGLEHRARLLLEVVDAVRAVLPPGKGLGLKLNTADFQRGGFDERDALAVLDLLAGRGLDLVELSGGSVERPVMHGAGLPLSTASRQAYFLEQAAAFVERTTIPLMLTGGVRSRTVAVEVVDRGIDVVGIGTALAVDPDLPNRWVETEAEVEIGAPKPAEAALAGQAKQAWVRARMRRIGAGEPEPEPDRVLDADAGRRSARIPVYAAWRDARRQSEADAAVSASTSS